MILLYRDFKKRVKVHLFTDSEATLESTASSKQIKRKTLQLTVKDLKEQLVERDIHSYGGGCPNQGNESPTSVRKYISKEPSQSSKASSKSGEGRWKQNLHAQPLQQDSQSMIYLFASDSRRKTSPSLKL